MANVLKNPNRTSGQQSVKKYIPNWVRLGIDPIVKEVNRSDFEFNNKENYPNRNGPTTSVASVSSGLATKRKTQVSIPQKPQVTIGSNQTWFDQDPDAMETENSVNQPIMYDEIPISSKANQNAVVSTHGETESSDLQENDVLKFLIPVNDLKDLLPGEYGILIRNQLIAKIHDKKMAEEVIESILFDNIFEIANLTIEDITLIHNLTLKIGILASE